MRSAGQRATIEPAKSAAMMGAWIMKRLLKSGDTHGSPTASRAAGISIEYNLRDMPAPLAR